MKQLLTSYGGVAVSEGMGSSGGNSGTVFGIRRRIYIGIGMICIALGAVGAVVPGLPTTVFLIVASWFFVRSSPALNDRLLGHPRFGPPLRKFLESRSMTARAKTKCIASMWIGISIASVLLWYAAPAVRIVVPLAGLAGTAAILFLVGTTPRGEEAATNDR